MNRWLSKLKSRTNDSRPEREPSGRRTVTVQATQAPRGRRCLNEAAHKRQH